MRSVLEEVVTYLAAELDVPVSAQAPATRPASFVVVSPVGGSSNADERHPEFAVQSWARTYDAAESLARQVCDAMLANRSMSGFTEPVPLGYDGTHRWFQSVFTMDALW